MMCANFSHGQLNFISLLPSRPIKTCSWIKNSQDMRKGNTSFLLKACSCCCQGGLDMQYLSARYEKGKQQSQEFISKRHCALVHKSIVLGHGEIVEKQAELGPATLLAVWFFDVLYFDSWYQPCSFVWSEVDDPGGGQHFMATTCSVLEASNSSLLFYFLMLGQNT